MVILATALVMGSSAGRPAAAFDLGQLLDMLLPRGADDSACRPPQDKPYPIVLVPGTGGRAELNWAVVSPALSSLGYCVFPVDYGNLGTRPIEESAATLSAFIDSVLAATLSDRVSIVGHSQGGVVARHYLRFLGGGSKVEDLIALGPPNHGTAHPLLPVAGLFCIACLQMATDSEFIRGLNAGSETEPNVDYTVIATRYDEVVVPYQSQFLTGPETQVTNVTLQDKCPLDLAEHVLIAYDPVVIQWILNALAIAGPADPSFTPRCV